MRSVAPASHLEQRWRESVRETAMRDAADATSETHAWPSAGARLPALRLLIARRYSPRSCSNRRASSSHRKEGTIGRLEPHVEESGDALEARVVRASDSPRTLVSEPTDSIGYADSTVSVLDRAMIRRSWINVRNSRNNEEKPSPIPRSIPSVALFFSATRSSPALRQDRPVSRRFDERPERDSFVASHSRVLQDCMQA